MLLPRWVYRNGERHSNITVDTLDHDLLFNYIYAILHSSSYRERYREQLMIDFPRIPMPRDIEMAASEDGVQFKCNIYGKGLSTRSEMLYGAPWPQYYWRLVADYTDEVTVGGETDKIEGIPNSEYMLLR